jgi:hypothetical protein
MLSEDGNTSALGARKPSASKRFRTETLSGSLLSPLGLADLPGT